MLYSTNANASKGLEYLQKRPTYNTYNQHGQLVQNRATLVNDDGTAHVAYEGAPGTRVFDLISKQKKGLRLNREEQEIVNRYWAKNPTAGLATLNQLGGNHNGGILTEVGKTDKSTTNAAGYSRVTRTSSPAASFSF